MTFYAKKNVPERQMFIIFFKKNSSRLCQEAQDLYYQLQKFPFIFFKPLYFENGKKYDKKAFQGVP